MAGIQKGGLLSCKSEPDSHMLPTCETKRLTPQLLTAGPSKLVPTPPSSGRCAALLSGDFLLSQVLEGLVTRCLASGLPADRLGTWRDLPDAGLSMQILVWQC